jgi:hypothetical protein
MNNLMLEVWLALLLVLVLVLERLSAVQSVFSRRIAMKPVPQLLDSWFHPHSSGVYATLPKASDPQDLRKGQQLDDFHAHRHLSRYERQYRLKADIGLEANWDSVYRGSNFADHRHLKAHEDPYIAMPLNQGYGTHYVSLWVVYRLGHHFCNERL